MTITLFHNARIFTASVDPDNSWAEAMMVEDGTVTFTGTSTASREVAGAEAEAIDLDGRLVLPGFIDSHTHLLMTGEALGKVELTSASTLAEIQARLAEARAADPGGGPNSRTRLALRLRARRPADGRHARRGARRRARLSGQ
ncbi:amidohydrolase family protein [Glutamicibacter halophytocola]|uniref:amidohydrolase family protein n=1 Tax=Glutamicibacter halophytocola TaxID=1933880 RepID=UPI003218E41C